MSYDRLPPGLKAGSYFCLYKSEPGNDGKKKKVPYRTCGARADPGNKAHLTDFTTAYETYCKGMHQSAPVILGRFSMEKYNIKDYNIFGEFCI